MLTHRGRSSIDIVVISYTLYTHAELLTLAFICCIAVAIWQLQFVVLLILASHIFILGIEMVVFDGLVGLGCAISAWVRGYSPKGCIFSPNPS